MDRLYLDIQRFSDGKVVINTELNTKDFENGLDKMQNSSKQAGSTIKNIVAGLGITKLISKGLSVISSSIDDAVKRVDTLNNFPKVMSNLGIGAKESSKAIDIMSEKLSGLPTTLDAGALAVQRFTSKNGDVAKSTDIFLALNNAILAGGASTQIQETALEQLSQSYAKGKMDMMEWRSIQTAMPAQLKQVADAMGISTDALGEMMREGDNTAEVMDKFFNTIIKLNKQGVNGFQSFEQQARNSTAGIGTAITVAKTQVVKGVATMIGGINKSLKKSNLGSLSDIIANIGKEAKKHLDNIGKTLSKIDFQKVGKIIKGLVPIVGSLIASITALDTVMKLKGALTFAKDITTALQATLGFIPALTKATASQQALNLAQSMSPIGLFAAGVAGLTVGLIALTNAFKDNNEETRQTNKVLDDYKNSMEEANQSRQEYLDDNMTEIKNYQDLANELDNLIDENGKVKDGYEERANFIVTTLNDALGTEISMTDGVISNYKEVKQSIEDVIKVKRAQVLMEAEEKKYNEALDQRTKLEEQYTEQVKTVKENLKKKQEVEKEIEKTYGLTNEQLQDLITNQSGLNNEYGISSSQYDDIIKKLSLVNPQYEQSKTALDNMKTAYLDNEQVITDYEIALGNLKDGNYDAVLGMYEDTTNYQGKTKEETQKNYDAAIEAQKLNLEELEKNRKKYSDEEYNALKSSGESKLKELEEQQKKYTSTTKEGQKKTSKEWNTGLSEQLSILTGKKIEFKKTADGHIQAYIDGQKQGKPMSKKEAKAFADDMVKEIDKAKTGAKTAGTNLIDGTTQGIQNQSSQNSAFSAISSFGSSLLSKLKASLKEHSPSAATREMGQYLIQGLELGVDDEENNALKQIDKFGDNVLDRFSNIDYNDIYKDMQNALNTETNKIGSSVQISGASQSVQQMLTASASFDGIIPLQVDLDGEVIYDNQQKISARKNLQYGGVR